MRKSSLSRLLVAAAAAVTCAAMCWREGSQVNPGYTQFAACPPSPETALGIAQRKEMIEIQRENHLGSEVKAHPREGPNKPILGGNCYVGSSRRHSTTLATAADARHGLCAGAEVDTNPKPNSSHEQNQLEELLV